MTTWKEAAQALEWISKIEPDTAELRARRHYTLARVALDSKDNQQALAEFERALAAKPDWDMALLGKGIAYIRMQAEPVAEQYYLKTVQVSPNWVFPRHNLAELYIKQTSMSRDRLAEAEAQAREAVRIAPNRATSQELLGRILYFESRFDEACRTLGRALELAAGQQARFDRRQVDRRFRHACGKASGQ
jgi:Flp pilus assembly protein TadD